MFDPVVFENLKVSLENQLYDLDNLDRRITIVDRKDIVDLAIMSRRWSLSYELPNRKNACPLRAEIILSSSVRDLSDEILELEGANPACSLLLKFICSIEEPQVTCPKIEDLVESIWGRDFVPEQYLTATFGSVTKQVEPAQAWAPLYFENVIELPFNRKINEEQMEDLEELIEHTIRTLDALSHAVL